MSGLRKRTIALAVAALSVAALGTTGAGARSADTAASTATTATSSRALEVTGLTDNGRLLTFRENAPDRARSVGHIRGLRQDREVISIDYRPATGDLYGLGDRGGVYTINDNNGRARLQSRLSEDLQGRVFDIDFNPTVDLLRIVSDRGQNLRANVDTGDTIVDGELTYPGPPPVTARGVTGAAYTNNDDDPTTATTLYDIDTNLDQVVIQAPANAGPLSPTGSLGRNFSPFVGFDIYSTVRGGSTVAIDAYASIDRRRSRSVFFEITLFNGRAERLGRFPERFDVVSTALPLNQR